MDIAPYGANKKVPFPDNDILLIASEMQKAASLASMLVLIFSTTQAMLIFGLSTVIVCTFGRAVLIFDICTAVPIVGQCKHKISTASMAGTDVVCNIGTAVQAQN